MTTATFGKKISRIEDPALVRGRGRFVDDIHMDGMLHAVFVRSQHAHARILSIDADLARSLEGVRAVLTAKDIAPYLAKERIVVALPDKNYLQHHDRFVLTPEEVTYVGEAIAVVVADSPYLAEDAASLVVVNYEPLPIAADCRTALLPGANLTHSNSTSNLIAECSSSYGEVAAAFANAPHVFKASFEQQRGVAHSIECRGCVARLDEVDDQITLWSSTQTPLIGARLLAELLGRDDTAVRVVAPDVGGGFGPKLVFYPEEAATAIAAIMLRKPVKWIEDRREHFVATTQERDGLWDAEIAVGHDGRILGVRGTLIHDHGAYTARGLTVPQSSLAALTLAYVVPAYHMDCKVVMTNKVPVTPIRGAGQPQGVFVMERLLDIAARELGIDRAEIRMRNLVPASAMPYKKGFVTRGGIGIELDSGDYPACMQDALRLSDWEGFPERKRQARTRGKYIGIGVANFVEATGRGPFEQVSVRVAPNGLIYVATGAAAMGQGTKTMLAQVVAHLLGGEMERVIVSTGDSSKVSMGFGGFNSRQTVMAGSSAHVAAVKVRQKILKTAAHLLETGEDDLEISGEFVHVKGVPDLKLSLAQIAKSSTGNPGYRLPGNLQPGIEATETVVIDAMTYANGSAVVEVEVDAETAEVRVARVFFVHDAGTVINPAIVDGQIHGGIAHGIGNTLYEWMAFSEDAQPLTTNLADYLLMTSTEMPKIILAHRESPSPLNPLGVKGVGEAGVIPMSAAIVSAIEDALSDFDVRLHCVPVKPSELSELIENASRLAR